MTDQGFDFTPTLFQLNLYKLRNPGFSLSWPPATLYALGEGASAEAGEGEANDLLNDIFLSEAAYYGVLVPVLRISATKNPSVPWRWGQSCSIPWMLVSPQTVEKSSGAKPEASS